MEIYAASKREQSAPAKQKVGTVKRSDSASASDALQTAQLEQAQLEKFQRTKEALDIIEEQAREAEEKFRQAAARRQTDPEKEGGDELEAMGEYLKVMQRCQEIARRLMRGDRVPPEDEQYLMTNDPKGYKLALAARKPNPHPKEWESVLEDIEGAETTGTAAEGTAGEARSLFAGDRGGGSGDGDSGEGGDDAAGG